MNFLWAPNLFKLFCDRVFFITGNGTSNMLNEEHLVPNGKSHTAENDTQNTTKKRQKFVSISEDSPTIHENKMNSENNSSMIKKISIEEKIQHDDKSDIDSNVNGKITSELTNCPHNQPARKMETLQPKTFNDSTSKLENPEVSVKQNGSREIENNINNDIRSKTRDVVTVNSEASAKPSIADERLTERRKSFVPMSSMEEENLRERLHLAQLRKCNEIILKDSRYTRENFRKLFQTEVSSILSFYQFIRYHIFGLT